MTTPRTARPRAAIARRHLTVAAALLIATGTAAWAWQHFQAPAVPDIAVASLDRELADAVQEARAAVQRDPRSAAAWGTLGQLLHANEIYPDIRLVCSRTAHRLEPRNPRWPYFAALALLNLGRPDDALPEFERAVALCDQSGIPSAAARLILAETLHGVGRADEAMRQFEVVLAQDATNPRAHFGAGVLASERDDWQGCRVHLEQCISSAQTRKKAATQLATVCERLGDRANADFYAQLAARLPKDVGWSDPFAAENAALAKRKQDRYRLVEELEADGQFRQALRLLHQTLEQYPDDFLAHLMMGRILGQMNEFADAEAHLQRTLELAPDKVQARYLLALVYERRGEWLLHTKGADAARPSFEAAAQTARAAMTARPDYGFAHMTLGLALRHLGQRTEAIAALRQALHCNPEQGDIHLSLGIALAEDGQLAEARSQLDQAVRLCPPNDPHPRAALARFFPK